MNTHENSNTASPAAPAGAGVDWEARWQAGETPWDKGAPAPPLVDWLQRHPLSGRVLVPGCGGGHDVRALAAAGAEPLGLDLSATAIAHARSFPRAGTESYCMGDFFALPEEFRGAFKAVVEHTCFCAIDPVRRTDYARAAAAALQPGGQLLAIFYLDPGAAEGPPFGATRAELDALFAEDFEMLEEYVPTVSYPGREGRELVRLLRRL